MATMLGLRRWTSSGLGLWAATMVGLCGWASSGVGLWVAASIGFGDAAAGLAGASRSLTVTNSGGWPLHVSSVGTEGAASEDFVITGDTCSGDPVASDGGTCEVRLRFAPTAVGARSATMRSRPF